MGDFQGFPKGGGAFFAELAKKQDRDWFKAHKERYETLWEMPMKALLGDLQRKLAKTFPGVDDVRPKVMRIYRDVRFSKDKSPFKTNIGATLALGKHDGAPAIYVHGDAQQTFVAAGSWMMEPGQLEQYREAVAGKPGEAFAKAVKALEAKGFTTGAHDRLKRVPAPYPADHPRGELLKLKGFGVSYPAIPAGLPAKPAFADWIAQQTKTAGKVLDWLHTELV